MKVVANLGQYRIWIGETKFCIFSKKVHPFLTDLGAKFETST